MAHALEDPKVIRISLTSPDHAAFAKRLREAFALPQEPEELVRIYCLGELQEKGEDGQRPVLVSTDDVDRMGDIVDPEGAELANYRKNPVVLWAHDYTLPPIGSAQWVKKAEHGILAKIRWASTEFAQQIKLLYDEGHMRAFSIGFLPKQWEAIKDKDNPDKPEWQLGRRYTKWEMLEFSAVPVPANPNALALALAKGLPISRDLAELLVPKTKTVVTVPADPVVVPCAECASLQLVLQGMRDGAEVLRGELDESKKANERFAQVVAELNTKIEGLEQANKGTIRIDVDAIRRDQQSAGIRVAGAEVSRDELKVLIAEVLDGRIRKLTGVVSS